MVELLRAELLASGQLEPTADQHTADAALKGRLVLEPPVSAVASEPTLRLELHLVDAGGRLLWSATRIGPSLEGLAKQAIGDLGQRVRAARRP
jgi:hypothetical protein